MPAYPLGPWEPDKAPRLNDGILQVADGVYALIDGYRPVGQWEGILAVLPNVCKGGASFTSPGGTSSIIAGTATGLYRARSGGWELLKDGYSIQGDQRWRFAQFGGLAIAANGADPLQKIDLTTGAVAVLGGNPPIAAILAVVKDFLVAAPFGGDVNALAWSGINNAEFWTYAQRQSDYNIMPSGGSITGILSGETGVILQRKRISLMEYVGGNTIFEINEASSNIGCVTIHSVAQWGRLGFFLAEEGFMMWDGSQPVPIGDEKINRWFAARYDKTTWPLMSTAIDPVQRVVMWSMGDAIIMYNWLLQRWTTITYASPIIFSGVTKDISLDEQDPEVGAPDDNLDGPGLVTFDDPGFVGGDPRLYVFSQAGALGNFSGAPMGATFTTGDIEMFSGQRADLRFARPDVDAIDGLTLTLQGRQRLGDVTTSAPFFILMASGDMPIRFSARYIRPTLEIEAGQAWAYAKGIGFTGQPGAGR